MECFAFFIIMVICYLTADPSRKYQKPPMYFMIVSKFSTVYYHLDKRKDSFKILFSVSVSRQDYFFHIYI